MHLELTDEQRAIQRLARDFADGEVRPVAEELDREKRFPYEIVEKLGELGLMGIPYPQEHG
ncbi:MAG TPA: acyl-CoA dehydrogenase family protein, partial [Thermoleophilaceae bacterium]|nr:acyl-CoA dehydrogenase family protein [Thermoleophilaceae bacterium]